VTPFNFKITESQLVASDRDTLLAVDGIDAYEVDHLSTWKTVLIASLPAPRRGWRWRLILAAIITVLTWLVFKQGLQMTMPVWPDFPG
jgi:hypothetical protein